MEGRQYAVVTSYSAEGYALYGKKFIETFRQHWPTNCVHLLVYTDDDMPFDPTRFVLPDVSSDAAEFLRRYGDDPLVKGRQILPGHKWKASQKQVGYNFRYDAYRFCRKVFALAHAATILRTGKMFWVDADVVTHSPVPLGLLDSVLPDGYDLSYLERRKGYHSECGFVGYNLDTPGAHDFIGKFAAKYATGEFKKYAEWHDSWVFDRLREELPVRAYRIPSPESHHPFIYSELGLYMDHLKGERKLVGRSYPSGSQRRPHDTAYWTEDVR